MDHFLLIQLLSGLKSRLVMINVRVGEQPSFLLYFNFVLLKAAVFDLFSSQILNLLTNNRSYLVQSGAWCRYYESLAGLDNKCYTQNPEPPGSRPHQQDERARGDHVMSYLIKASQYNWPQISYLLISYCISWKVSSKLNCCLMMNTSEPAVTNLWR